MQITAASSKTLCRISDEEQTNHNFQIKEPTSRTVMPAASDGPFFADFL